jgi:hypothetical protein
MEYIVAAKVVAALAIVAAIEPVVAAAEALAGRKVENCP